MVRRALAFALQRGVEAGSPDAVGPALRGVDPLIRLLARRRWRSLAARARLCTTSDDPRHLLRVAFLLLVVGMPAAEWDDEPAIAREYLEAVSGARAPLRGPWLSVAALLALVMLIALPIGIHLLTRPFDPREGEVGHALGSDVPGFVVALSQGSFDEASALRKRATSRRAALGDPATKELDALLESADALARAQSEPKAAVERFTAATVSFDNALAQRNLPYFLDADVLGGAGSVKPLLFSFYAEREAYFESGGNEVRVLHLWRLDRLNLVQGYLGYTRPSTPAALVLLDQVEADLVEYVLPALPAGEPMTLADLETRLAGEEWVDPLEKWGGERVRAHYALVPEANTPQARRVATLLARRRSLIDHWRKDLAGLGHVLRVPERLIPEADYAKELELRISRAQLTEWDDLHAELTSRQLLGAFLALRGAYVRAVERHEVQHRLDYARGLVPVPEILCRMLGVDNPLDAPQGGMAARARDELSAYLASIISAEQSPVLELLLLSRHLFDKSALGGAYWYAALAAYRGIAGELDIDPQALLGRGAVSRARAGALVQAVLGKPPEELRQAAARFYEKAYGQRLPPVTLRRATDHRAWRH